MTTRHFGWRPSPPDIRDHRYSVPTEIMKALPPKVDLAGLGGPLWNPVWEQGSIGSCGPFSAAADLVFAGRSQEGLATMPMPSKLFIYYATRMLMGTVNEDSGVYNRDLLKSLNKYGWCDETLWPYNVGAFAVKPYDHCFTQAATRRITQYLAVTQNLEQMKGCLAGNDPFLFGFTVYESFYDADNDGMVPMPSTSERVLGGHDVLFVGYDDATQRFKFRNSWGPWGDGGYGYMPYAYATHPQLAGDFWTVRQSALPPAPPAIKTITLQIPASLTAGKTYRLQEVTT